MVTNFQLVRIFLLALGASAITVWSARRIAVHFGVYDPPGKLKIHRGPIPRVGGVGILFGFLVGTASSKWTFSSNDPLLLAAVALIWAIGIVDDLRGLSPALRLVCQCLAGLTFHRSAFGLSQHVPSTVGAVLTCVVVVACVNAFNFLDGSDGLASGIAALVGIGFCAIGHDDPGVLIGGLALAAAAIGFLLFNFPPAQIFMGDSGSTVLGFVVAALTLRYAVVGVALNPQRIERSLLLLALPAGDFIFAIMRRLWLRQSPWFGDRSHFYDLLLQRGWSPKRVAVCSYVVTAALTAAAVVR